MPNFLKRTGFTLIELMVAISVLSIVLATGIVSYRNFNRSQTVQAAAYEVQQLLRTGQLKARAKDTPAVSCEILRSYRAHTSGGAGAAVSLSPYCQNGIITSQQATVLTKTLPSSVTVTSFSFYFQTLGGGVSHTSDSTVTVSSVDGTVSYVITIGSGGSISDPVRQ